MTKIFTLFAFFGFCILNAQEKLIIEYESRLEFDAESFANNVTTSGDRKVNNQEIVNALKESMTKPNYYTLSLTPNESEFKFLEKIENEQPTEGHMKVKIVMGGMGVTYKNLQENISLKTEEPYNKNFLVNDTLQNYDWAITKETKEILGYEVRKATATIDSTNLVEAWYAPKLPYKNGPEFFQGLPGLILEVQSHKKNDMTHTYRAISLNIDTENKPIERPKKGKSISQKEFKAFMDEQSKKMQEMYGGGIDKD
ncbi:MAG: GLPGLI family protein [Moheibacter sp.]